MVKVLIIDDELPVRMLTKAKYQDMYEIAEAGNGEEAFDVLDHQHVDLILCDIMMPEMDGYEFLKELRGAGYMTPVIFLTAMSTFAHKKKGFTPGIDDYVTKPIDYEELQWRIEAILRRTKIANNNEIVIGQLKLIRETMTAFYKEEEIVLTQKEYELMYKFLSYPNVVFTKQQLMDEIWGYDTESDYNTIKTYISRLRKKFASCKEIELVSLRGIGYKVIIQEDNENEE